MKVWALTCLEWGWMSLLALGSRLAAEPRQAGSWSRHINLSLYERLHKPELLNFGVQWQLQMRHMWQQHNLHFSALVTGDRGTSATWRGEGRHVHEPAPACASGFARWKLAATYHSIASDSWESVSRSLCVLEKCRPTFWLTCKQTKPPKLGMLADTRHRDWQLE